MKSIKPGRGPSMMSGISAVFAGIFGVFWTMIAVSMGAYIMVPFGFIFIGIAVVQAIYNFKNATGEKRYSVVDIVEDEEEPDPLNERFGTTSAFCPYCGEKVAEKFEFCPKCGKRLP